MPGVKIVHKAREIDETIEAVKKGGYSPGPGSGSGSSSGDSIPEAPKTGQIYGRKNKSWVPIHIPTTVSQLNSQVTNAQSVGAKLMYDTITAQNEIIQTLTNALRDLGGGVVGGHKHIFITQEDYDNLEEYERNALYFIVPAEAILPEEEPKPPHWGFGGQFPLQFGSPPEENTD